MGQIKHRTAELMLQLFPQKTLSCPQAASSPQSLQAPSILKSCGRLGCFKLSNGLNSYSQGWTHGRITGVSFLSESEIISTWVGHRPSTNPKTAINGGYKGKWNILEDILHVWAGSWGSYSSQSMFFVIKIDEISKHIHLFPAFKHV